MRSVFSCLFVIFASVFALSSCTTASKRAEAPKKQPVAVKIKPKTSAGNVGGMAGPKPVTPPPPTQPTAKEESATAALVQKEAALERDGHFPEALRELVNLSVTAPTKQEQEAYRLRAIEMAENKLDEDALKNVARDSDYGFIRGHAMYKLGELALDAHDKDSAKKYFTSVTEFLPGSDLAARSQDIISQLDASRFVQSKTIGVVLPLSGKNANIGQRALRGIEMGLGLNLPGSGFKLAVMDSEGNPDNARRGVERLVKEDNVIAIIGSLLSKTAPAVASKADELGVPTIALSQRSGINEAGPRVFRNALTSEMQIRYLVRVAIDEMGIRKFGIMYPNDPYGVEYANIFWDEVLARGGEITAVQTYGNKETDFRYPIQRLVGTFYAEARNDEYKARLKELQKDKKHSGREKTAEDILPPVVDFDALFIPDSARALGQISAMLAYNDVRGIKLLGTNLWNTKDIAKRAGNSAGNLLFVDSFLSSSASDKIRFVSEYKSLFKEEPSLIEIQAYDSALILRQLVAGGASTRDDLSRRLMGLKKFPGALGSLDMSPDREIERPLMALTIEHGEITPLRARR